MSVLVPTSGEPDRYASLNDAAARADTEWLAFPLGERRPEPASISAALADRPGSAAAALVLPAATLLVRRTAFESAGGFAEGVVAGAELDLCLRLRDLGAEAELPPPPADGAALRWLRRRHPASGFSRQRSATWRGLAGDNRLPSSRVRPTPSPGRSLVVFTDAYPARSETFIYREVAALAELGWRVRVESSARPARAERAALRARRVDFLEDDPPLRGLLDLARLALRHPLRCLADVRDRRRWAGEEEPWPLRALAPAARRLRVGGERHIHVHFAAGAALHTMRIARITGVSWSVVGHGYDVFAGPRNLGEKLRAADFVVAPCEYTGRHLRGLLPPARRERVHVIVMGIDGGEFRRSLPPPRGRSVVAIGRLVEKKGFRYLVEAAGLLDGPEALERLEIAGDGPLRDELEEAMEAAGLGDRAVIVDAWGAAPVRALLERADVLAMPAVIAADGDRDAMPVVVKEALAMEIPVVATDEVGLPELVRPEWGALVEPRDPQALARALADLLAVAPERRAEMGAAGRAHVLSHCDVHSETAKLAALVEATLRERAPR